MNVLVKSATIVDATNKALHLKKRDIFIKKGTIDQIAQKVTPTGKFKTIALPNLHVSLGWFDSGVSFGEPGFEERETIANGLMVAGKNGFTDIVLNPTTNPVPDSSSDIVFLKNAARNHATNLYPLGTMTVKGEGVHLAELFDMQNAGAVGFYDFQRAVENSNLLKIALQYAQNFQGLVYSFPMDLKIAGKGIVNEGPAATKLGLKGIPALAEELQIARDLSILAYTGGKLHIPTISSAASVKLIADAKKKGLNVSCSVAIHNLCFTDEVLQEFDTHYKVLPPLRGKSDQKALLKGIKDGTIDMVTTDHMPIDIEQKRVEFDNAVPGSIGLESAFGILNRLFDTEKTIRLLTTGRARYGIVEPSLKNGANACLTLFDPYEEKVFKKSDFQSTSKNSAFIGQPAIGTVYGTISGNKTVL